MVLNRIDTSCSENFGPQYSTGPDGSLAAEQRALYYAVSNNHPEVIKILLDAGADPNAKMGAYSMLGIAASSSSVEMLSALLTSQKIDINVRDARGNTPDMLVMWSDAPLEQKVASLRLLMDVGVIRRSSNLQSIVSE
jgi:hypothetical protein